jgi:hypothetical protein
MKKLLILILPVILLASCAKNLSDYNIDEKNPDVVSAGSLFANSLKQLTDNVTSASVNVNVFRFWIQQWSTTTYQDEPRYNITTRNIPLNFWTPMYREVLQDLGESKRLTNIDASISTQVKNNRLAVIEVTSIYTWSVLVNTWGDIPYSEAFTTINQPKYDKAADIYADLLKRLDAAIALMTSADSNFGGSDLLYEDNTAAWIKFANSLKLKLGITLADVDEATARTVVQASAAGAFTSNSDNAAFRYLSQTPNNNPVSNDLNPIYTSRQDYVASNVVVNLMNDRNDPRRPFYFTTVGTNYVGGIPGVNNTYANYSHPSDKVIAPNLEALLLDYSEVEFILAEASARWGILGTPAEHYSKAVTASVTYWGGTADVATAYLLNPTVAYATAEGTYKQKIGIQKYLALYNRGYDAWTEWRRLDYPVLAPATGALSVIPKRITYPTSERTLNRASVEAASTAIGGDEVATKLFWDKF